jgi:DNA-binding transcriptional MocR family regulator
MEAQMPARVLIAPVAGDGSAGLHGSVLDQLGVLITAGDIGSGQVLRIEQLATRFGVSRSVIREAIRVLESMGMLSSRRRVGVTVAPPATWNVFDRASCAGALTAPAAPTSYVPSANSAAASNRWPPPSPPRAPRPNNAAPSPAR